MERISAVIIAYNEEEKLRACLESVKWADDIVVVDSFSTDSTRAIASSYTDRIYQRAFSGMIEQKRYATNLAKFDWIINIDADEIISEELRDEILQIFKQSGPEDHTGFVVPRRAYYINRWFSKGCWFPDRKLRLFRRSCGRWEGMEPHDRFAVDGRIGSLKSPLYHVPFRNIADHIDTLNNYTTIGADQLRLAGRSTWPSSPVLHGLYTFVKTYFFKLGLLEGMPGLIASTVSAFHAFTPSCGSRVPGASLNSRN
jgi:glycosyltransferase involved in cell wall biosynthesis